MGIGPMRDMTIGDPVSSAPGSHDRRGPSHLVACSGQGKHGALTVLRRNLVPELIVQVPQGTCQQTPSWPHSLCRVEGNGYVVGSNPLKSVSQRYHHLDTYQLIIRVQPSQNGPCTATATVPPPPCPQSASPWDPNVASGCDSYVALPYLNVLCSILQT